MQLFMGIIQYCFSNDVIPEFKVLSKLGIEKKKNNKYFEHNTIFHTNQILNILFLCFCVRKQCPNYI